MDFSEKDAARSKFKLSQKHKRGRGRGFSGAGGRDGGRGRGRGRGSSAPATTNLISNTDVNRYDDVGAHGEAEGVGGPVRQSEGSDLADLLAQAEAFDRGYYYRRRVNLAQELELPAGLGQGAFQGLSIDLKGLAACLERVPKNQLLDTNAFSDDDDAELAEEAWGVEESGELLDREEPGGDSLEVAAKSGQQQQQPQQQRQQQQQIPDKHLQHGLSQPVAASTTLHAPAALAAGQGGGVDDLLSELLGSQGSSSTQQQQQQQKQQHQQRPQEPQQDQQQVQGQGQQRQHQQDMLGVAAAPPIAAGNAGNLGFGQVPPRSQQQGFQQPPATVAAEAANGGGTGAAVDGQDDELDMLLGLGTGGGMAAPYTSAIKQSPSRDAQSAAAQTSTTHEAQSLEDWLEGL